MTPAAVLTSLIVMAGTFVMTSSVDLTLQPDSTGTAVVIAVVNKIRDRCIFSDDRLFLRRLSYVVSEDGLDTSAYTPGQDGGIWKTCSSALISSTCQTILSELSIDWSGSVTWTDLRKPLYSGLAAALYSLLNLNGSTISGDINLQAQFFATAFGGDQNKFVSLAPNATIVECSDKMDLLFILDSSGSVSSDSFTLMRSFAADVVQVMDVDSDAVRVADVVYGNYVNVIFDLNDYTTSTDIQNALKNTVKLGGGTMTDDALDQAAQTLYDANSGARTDAKKVVILITDGQSFSPSDTAIAAVALKDKGTTVFAVGVGNYDLTELHAVATSPTCSHVLTLTDFSSILSILSQIQSSTCDANLVLTPGTEVSGVLSASSSEVVTRTLNPGPNSTIVVNATCGTVQIYLSYTDASPSPVLYEEFYNTTHNEPAYITTRDNIDQGSPVYMMLVGSRFSSALATQYNCQNYQWTISVQEPDVKIRLVSGSRASEGRIEVFINGTWGTICDDNFGVYDGIVACRMLGYEKLTPVVRGTAYYGGGTGTISLDEMACVGGESSLFECQHPGVQVHDCTHNEDVGVDCESPTAEALLLARLVDGSQPSEGRLEINNGGTWGNVCDDDFDVNDAIIVCNMLNYTGYIPHVMAAGQYGTGKGDIWLDDVGCTGSETSIFVCPHNGLGVHNCSHSQDVGIDCLAELITTTTTTTTTTTLPATVATAASTGGGDNSGLIAGAAGAGAGALLLVAGGLLLRKFLAGNTAVQDIKTNPEGGGRNRSRSESSISSFSSSQSDTESPIPGMADNAPSMRMPSDTRLPPLVNNNVVFPALRR